MEIIIGVAILIGVIYLFSKLNSKSNVSPVISSVKSNNLDKPQPKTEFILTDEFKNILEILKNSNESVFITGKAGTGKS